MGMGGVKRQRFETGASGYRSKLRKEAYDMILYELFAKFWYILQANVQIRTSPLFAIPRLVHRSNRSNLDFTMSSSSRIELCVGS